MSDSPIQELNNRDTKKVILGAYEELAKAYRALDKKLKSASKQGAKPSGAAPAAPTTALAKITPLPAAGLAGQLGLINAGIGDYTAGLQQSLSAEAVTLRGINEEVEALTARLQSLHELSVEEGTLTRLIADYEELAKRSKDEQAAKNEAAKQAVANKRDELKQAKEAAAAALATARAESETELSREAELYDYDLARKRKLEQEQEAQAGKSFAEELGSLRAEHEARWTAREAGIAEREAELSELESKGETLDESIAAARKRGESEGMGIARRETKAAAELLAKENEGKRKVYELRIAGLEQTLTKQTQQIGDLSKQLDTALAQAQDLAVKAIEGSSNATSFDAIREIAMEQAKTSGKGK